MLPARRRNARVILATLALAAPAAPAAADGLPLPVEDSPSGVLSHDGAARFLAVSVGGRTAVLAQDTATGAITSRANLAGRFGIPLVAYDSSAGGVSHDGRTLVMIRPRSGFPRRATTFAVLAVQPRLRLRRLIRLPGDFSYDALSPDGSTLFLINYLSSRDPTQYRVRVFDLARDRLDPKPVVDPREAPGEMNGLPLTRVSSPDGRWAYTLYDGVGGRPFIHALDTRERAAVCIDLDGPAFRGVVPHELRLAVAAGGRRLDVRRNGAVTAAVDTATFRVGAPVAATPAAVAPRSGGIPTLLWPAIGGVLALTVALVTRRAVRARGGRPALRA